MLIPFLFLTLLALIVAAITYTPWSPSENTANGVDEGVTVTAPRPGNGSSADVGSPTKDVMVIEAWTGGGVDSPDEDDASGYSESGDYDPPPEASNTVEPGPDDGTTTGGLPPLSFNGGLNTDPLNLRGDGNDFGTLGGASVAAVKTGPLNIGGDFTDPLAASAAAAAHAVSKGFVGVDPVEF